MTFNARTHCCFCGAYNADDPKGYAGERCCSVCGKGGIGERDESYMYYKHGLRAASPAVPKEADTKESR